MAITFLVFGILFLGAGLFFLIKTTRSFVKDPRVNELGKKERKILILSYAAIAAAGGFLQAAIDVFAQWQMENAEAIFAVAGATLFALTNASLWSSFYLHYWKPGLEEKQSKWFKRVMFASIPLVIIFFLVLGEGVAKHLTYPLVSGFEIGSKGWLWVNYSNWQPLQSQYGGLHIAWYGIIMVFSAIVVYWICDHEFYKEFHKHGILDTALLVCFPAGVIGGRIGYVIGNWNGDGAGGPNFSQDFANGRWYTIFQIWNGGLTILGGALGGIIVGVIFFMRHRKYVNVRWAADIVVPAILVAQAIGRWGNFFNHEVYGAKVDMSQWMFLPTWLRNQMATSFTNGLPTDSKMYVPLFLIESLINLAGYFVIKYAIGKPLKKVLAKGDLAGCYLIWYGIVRVIMEPMRNPSFKMGSDGKWSVIWSAIYIGLGALTILFFHLFDYFRGKKQQEKELQEGSVAAVPVAPIKPIESATPTLTEPSKANEGKDEPLKGEDKPIGSDGK